MTKIENYSLVDCALVEVRTKGEDETTPSGIIVPANDKVSNYGTVLHPPTVLIDQKYQPLFDMLTEGDRVFFPVNASYNFVEQPDRSKKWMLIPLHNIQLVAKTTES